MATRLVGSSELHAHWTPPLASPMRFTSIGRNFSVKEMGHRAGRLLVAWLNPKYIVPVIAIEESRPTMVFKLNSSFISIPLIVLPLSALAAIAPKFGLFQIVRTGLS